MMVKDEVLGTVSHQGLQVDTTVAVLAGLHRPRSRFCSAMHGCLCIRVADLVIFLVSVRAWLRDQRLGLNGVPIIITLKLRLNSARMSLLFLCRAAGRLAAEIAGSAVPLLVAPTDRTLPKSRRP